MECLICYKDNSTIFEEKNQNLSISIVCKLLEVTFTAEEDHDVSTSSICPDCSEKLMQVHRMLEELDDIQLKIYRIKSEICHNLIKSEELSQVGGNRLEIRTKIVEELCSRPRIFEAKNAKGIISHEFGPGQNNDLVSVGTINEPLQAVQNPGEMMPIPKKRGRKQKLKPLLVQQQNSPLDLDSPTISSYSFNNTSPRRSTRKRKSNEDSDFIFDQKFVKNEKYSLLKNDGSESNNQNQNEYFQLISSEEQASSLSDVIDFELDFNDHDHNSNGKITKEKSPLKTKRNIKRRNKPTKKKCERNSNGLYQCDTCGITYNKFSSWRTHKSVHLPKKFICSISDCKKAFTRKEMLIAHAFVHQEPQFECSVCLKKLKSKKSLDTHMLIHKGIKKFKCECGKAFTQKINLITHKDTHLPPEKKGFSCKICGKQFAQKEYLGYHIEGHVKGKKLICNLCGKYFLKNHLLSHIKSSHGPQKWNCPFCQLNVKTKQSFTRHLEKIHNNRKEIWNVEGYIDTCYEPGDGLQSQSENNFDSEEMNQVSGEISEIIPIETAIESGEIGILENSQFFSVSENNVMILQMEGGEEIVLNLDLITTTDTDTI